MERVVDGRYITSQRSAEHYAMLIMLFYLCRAFCYVNYVTFYFICVFIYIYIIHLHICFVICLNWQFRIFSIYIFVYLECPYSVKLSGQLGHHNFLVYAVPSDSCPVVHEDKRDTSEFTFIAHRLVWHILHSSASTVCNVQALERQ